MNDPVDYRMNDPVDYRMNDPVDYRMNDPVGKTRKIKHTNRSKTAKFLKFVCPNSSECILFGKESDKIRSFFNGFTDFKYLETNATRLRIPSKNGIIHRLKYRRKEYVAYAILKSINMKQSEDSASGSSNPDNLIYEYLVGRFLNRMSQRFSCFIETYGLFFYKSDVDLREMKKMKKVSAATLQSSLIMEPVGENITYELLKKSCDQYKYVAILLQEIHEPFTMYSAVKSSTFVKTELLQTLYQVYFPLATLCNYFTHYDLHSENVLLYRLDAGKYATFHYTRKDGSIIVFHSQYIAKIIDYGRAFFVDKDINSKMLQKTICNISSCGNCGKRKGYDWLNPSATLSSDSYIASDRSNISHDLRLLHDIRSIVLPRWWNSHTVELGSFMYDLETKLKYGVGIQSAAKKEYGTKENRAIGFPSAIHNVVDAETWLSQLLQLPSVRESQSVFYTGKTKIGDIFMDTESSVRFVQS